MKKHSLTKILTVVLLLVIVTTYVIDGREGISYLGLGDVALNYFQSFYYFFDTILFILMVGALYGLLEHIPAYTKLQETIVEKVSNKKLGIFAIILIFILLSALTGLNLILLIFVPFAISLILTFGYDKLVALFSTVGAITVGYIGGILVTFRNPNDYYGSSFSTFETFIGLENQYETLLPKLVLLIVATIMLIIFVNKYINKITKKEEKEEQNVEIKEEKKEQVSKIEKEDKKSKENDAKETKKEHKIEIKKENKKEESTKDNKEKDKKTTNNKNKTSSKKKSNKKNLSAAKKDETIVIKSEKQVKIWPLITILATLLILLALGYMPWNSLFKITIFDEFHQWLTEIKFGDYAIFTNLISKNFTAFGTWGNLGNYMMALILLIVTILIIKVAYKIKFNNMLDYCGEGMKKMLPSGIIAMLAYTVLICSYNHGFMETIIASAVKNYGSNIMIHSLITILGSITNVDVYYTAAGIFSNILNELSTVDNANSFAIVFQSFYGLVQLVGPTSIMLLVCLAYTNVSYKDWFKNIWRLVLTLFIAIFAIVLLVTLL